MEAPTPQMQWEGGDGAGVRASVRATCRNSNSACESRLFLSDGWRLGKKLITDNCKNILIRYNNHFCINDSDIFHIDFGISNRFLTVYSIL